VHNAEETLRLSVISTLGSLGADDRLHVFFDACTDDSVAVIKNVRDRRLRVVGASKEKLGVKGTLNELLATVETSFVSRMDADDMSFPWRFRRQKALLSGYDFVFSTAIVFGKSMRPMPIIPQLPISLSGFASHAALLFGNPFVHPSMSAKTEVIRHLGGYKENFGQDYGLWLRAALQDFTFLRDALPSIGYRFHPNQVSSSKDWAVLRASDTTIANLQSQLELKIIKDYGLQDREEVLQRLYFEVPLLKYEHKGLPKWLRAWKDARRFKI
jgi:hypothetical protein